MFRVLVLGAGRVAGPLVRYLLDQGIFITLADQVKSQAADLIRGYPSGIPLQWSADDQETLGKLISRHDLTVSFLPYFHHVNVARHCISLRKNMVTTSYVKPEMQILDRDARDAGVVILNEAGLDPGIDHMSAIRIIDRIHEKGGRVDEFYSLCGALPAPEAAGNPFKYKFSWSPKGVLMAGNSDVLYLKEGKPVSIPGQDLFKHPAYIYFPGIGELEVYPNRDSVQYIDIYKIPEVKTMFRGTLRYPGWCAIMDAFKSLGLLTCGKLESGPETYARFTGSLIGYPDGRNIKERVAAWLNLDPEAAPVKAMEWLGLFSGSPLKQKEEDPFEVTADLMIGKMELAPGDRDMVAMQHLFRVSYPDGRKEVIKSRMLDFGSPGKETSIARTVGLPAAIGVMMILEGKIRERGILRPVIREIYNPLLDALEATGIRMTEEQGVDGNGDFSLPDQ